MQSQTPTSPTASHPSAPTPVALSVVVIADAGEPLQKLVRSPGAAGIVIVGTAPSAIAASQLGLHAAADLCLVIAPLVVGLVATIRQLSRERVANHIVVLAQDTPGRDDLLVPALASGADGWLSTDLEPAMLGRSLQAVVNGEPGVSREHVGQLISALRKLTLRDVTLEDGRTAGLTAREQQILLELSVATPTRVVAQKLGVSEGTVRWHSARLFKKLDVTSREELAAVLARSDVPSIPRSPAPLPSAAAAAAALRPMTSTSIDWRRLAPGELRIIRLVADGMTNREIAAKLFLSKHTVDSHLKNAFAKLSIRSRVELTRLLLTNEPETRTG